MPAPEDVLMLARYNAWQNREMKAVLEALPTAVPHKPCGLHFGTILATVNHLLWADRIWMSRLADWPRPEGGIASSVDLTPTLSVWAPERFRADARLIVWAEGLRAASLHGDLRWYSAVTGREQVKPVAQCVLHLFTHQAHHRGQIHAAITAQGAQGWTSDLVFMPDGGPWL
ncbi:DinB family protein [Salipiger aestuarii]|uniref:DinB family protein n=1 Tax=Salipiger aestuarii TaxID=568098 RepID=UPI00123ADECB|nr:DinB family protein [Salipiger aestuarii]KAA8614293.1 damage-inducible protein DinB [Salipiger aestuarii]